ncbi:MAG: transporter substrate-binding protein [Frankiales bacterium]|nr:transporter substrate-binding protein [Frankiales bacterium]
MSEPLETLVTRRATRSAGLLAVLALAAACTSSPAATTAASSTDGTLHLAYLADMSVPDPDVFYDIEGNAVILSAYEGLVKYAPDSTTIVPSLATKYVVSPDGLTYTFTLRDGVTFHDGTPFDSAAVKASLERRTAVGNAPAYMLEPVKTIATPDPRTVVLTLKGVTSPFLDYLASSWGPKMISPKALTENAGTDHAQTWAKSHADGTGPYQLTGFSRGSTYTLTRFDGYWGEKAKSKQVDIRITPDMNAQILALRSGDQDVVLHSYPVAELPQAAEDPALEVERFGSFLQSMLYLNTQKAPFDDPAVRKALAGAIDRDEIVEEVYGEYGSPAKSTYPKGILDPALAPVSYPASTAKVPGSPKVDFAYSADESGVQKRLAQLLQQKLVAAGFVVTVREVQPAQAYGFAADVQHAPSMMLQTNTPDAAHPDTWARILWGTGGGLNFFGYSNKTVDALLDQGRATTDKAAADALYGRAGQLLAADGAILFLADVEDTMVVRKDLTGLEHVPNYPWTLDLAKLSRS